MDIYGLIASLGRRFRINYFFMFPYRAFSSVTATPVAMISMTLISGVVCALTPGSLQAVEAMKREQDTKALYELNAKLNEEKAAIQLEAARETIRGNSGPRTPLTAISGAASVLLSSEEMIAQSEKPLVQDIKSDADALIAMVENLLSITKIRDGTMPLNKQEEMLEEVALRRPHHHPPPLPRLSRRAEPVGGHPLPAHGAHAHQAGDRQPAGKRHPPLRGPGAHPAAPLPSGRRRGGGGGARPGTRHLPGGQPRRTERAAALTDNLSGDSSREWGDRPVCLSKHH